jgi:hypothetical protein
MRAKALAQVEALINGSLYFEIALIEFFIERAPFGASCMTYMYDLSMA